VIYFLSTLHGRGRAKLSRNFACVQGRDMREKKRPSPVKEKANSPGTRKKKDKNVMQGIRHPGEGEGMKKE